ncbi:hypothetical protein [Paenibacillus contaminans]|uniref:DUF4179 domain-containing protein n=1 Tax=Paenibacillus contaminans TaxID=450362 RepID=A0A329LLW7_9BACL|nr:hypothetical protein [Paenibacillus contaminans]RAV08894.1 hypothetical protein DQG23_40330 [Paenibacillus contaminans]
MSDSEKWDRMLKQALASTEEPGEHVNQSIINRFKERNQMKHGYRKKMSIGVLAAVLTLAVSISAIAASQLFSSKQVAEHLGENSLAKAFEGGDAIEINRSVASGDYQFTLHGIVSGAGLRELESSPQDINPDRTYAVVSVARQDGAPMPKTSDPEYGKDPFFVSPFIKGQKPWQVNIMTMKGGYGEFVMDGVMYRLIECDDVEMFADRGVYLAISSGGSFYNSEAFAYNEATGEISPKSDYKGSSIVFDLPLNKAKADPSKAEAYLKELLKEPASGKDSESAAPVDDAEAELVKHIEDLKRKIPEGTVIPESVKEVSFDKNGSFTYEYDDWRVTLSPETLFTEGQTGFSDSVHFSGTDDKYLALQFSRDEKGMITGRVIDLQ